MKSPLILITHRSENSGGQFHHDPGSDQSQNANIEGTHAVKRKHQKCQVRVLKPARITNQRWKRLCARTINKGQSCIAAKRFIVDQSIPEVFECEFIEQMAALKIGDPLLDETDIGPLATSEEREMLDAQVKKAIEMGARVLVGGKPLAGPGYHYGATVLIEIPQNSLNGSLPAKL